MQKYLEIVTYSERQRKLEIPLIREHAYSFVLLKYFPEKTEYIAIFYVTVEVKMKTFLDKLIDNGLYKEDILRTLKIIQIFKKVNFLTKISRLGPSLKALQ